MYLDEIVGSGANGHRGEANAEKLIFPAHLANGLELDEEENPYHQEELLSLKRETFRVARYFCIGLKENQALILDFVIANIRTLLCK